MNFSKVLTVSSLTEAGDNPSFLIFDRYFFNFFKIFFFFLEKRKIEDEHVTKKTDFHKHVHIQCNGMKLLFL
jgi:hypothetical protein